MSKKGKEGTSISPFTPPSPAQRPPKSNYSFATSSRSTNLVEIPKFSDDSCEYSNSNSTRYQDNGNDWKHDTNENTLVVKHFVSSTDRYHIVESVNSKPTFRGPETDILQDLENNKLKTLCVQMIRSDLQQNKTIRKSYVLEESNSRKKENDNYLRFHNRPTHFNSTQINFDCVDKNYKMSSPGRMSRDRSMSPRFENGRPPSPPSPYSERDPFNPNIILCRDRSKQSPEGNDQSKNPDNFSDQHKLEDFSSGPPPKPRSPDTQRFRPVDHNKLKTNEKSTHYDDRQRHNSGSPPMYYEKKKKNIVDESFEMSSPKRMSRDRSMSPRFENGRPPSPPSPYPERDPFNSNIILCRDRSKQSPEGNDQSKNPDNFSDQHKLEDFSSGPPPEPRSPDTQRFRPVDHNKLKTNEKSTHYDDRERHSSGSPPIYFKKRYSPFKSSSPRRRPYSRNNVPVSPPRSREQSPSFGNRQPHFNGRPQGRRSPLPRYSRSRERRRRSPRRRTPPRSTSANKRPVNVANRKKRSTAKIEGTSWKNKDKKKHPNSKQVTEKTQEEQNSIPEHPNLETPYPPPPLEAMQMPRKPFPSEQTMVPVRPPFPYPPPMGVWRPPPCFPMSGPPHPGWSYPPRPGPYFYHY